MYPSSLELWLNPLTQSIETSKISSCVAVASIVVNIFQVVSQLPSFQAILSLLVFYFRHSGPLIFSIHLRKSITKQLATTIATALQHLKVDMVIIPNTTSQTVQENSLMNTTNSCHANRLADLLERRTLSIVETCQLDL